MARPLSAVSTGDRDARNTATDAATAFAEKILDKLVYNCARSSDTACDHDWYMATALAARDHVVDRWLASQRRSEESGAKQVNYLSVEFLIGRLLLDTLTNLRMADTAREALAGLGIEFERLRKLEPDAALGNGGLGRLAACFMDSMASLGVPATGYGIRYDHGLFRQQIRGGAQHEVPDDWLSLGNPWEFERSDVEFSVCFGGTVEGPAQQTGKATWHPGERVLAVAFDTPLAGWRGRHVNTLRLWSARAPRPLHLSTFNRGDYVGAMAASARAEAISRVLYPSDATASGQELRLRQEYFFTAASLQDIVARHLRRFPDLTNLHAHAAIQLNDTHPAVAVPELMRILIDEHGIEWGQAWEIARASLGYTNHTLLPEALESWSVELFGRLLPRHLQIVYMINWLHLKEASKSIHDTAGIAAVSIIQEGADKRVRMGQLAFVGSHKVNGVSALHTDLLRRNLFAGLDALYPGRIVNETNGISFRRWLQEANPGLTALLVETLGERVLDDPGELKKLEPLAADPAFVRRYAAARAANKERLARRIGELTGVAADPSGMFDVQIKRIHEYKRQLLNILETAALYFAMRDVNMRGKPGGFAPRVKLFAGKAAPNYERAKLIIRLIHDVARVVNEDTALHGRLKVAFLPDYNVSLAEEIIAAADLSEQISTAGMEASGTGNMKLALNGALTIGTLDGANVEICEHVGADNIFVFGLKTDEVAERRAAGFEGQTAIDSSAALARVLDALEQGRFSPDEPGRYQALVSDLKGFDPFMVAADFDACWRAQREVDALWRDPPSWWRKSILNTARTGWFSSDRAIRGYAADIWGVELK